LNRYASHSTTHLVLPQVRNPQYVEFYQRKRREGDFLLLDNGAYENVSNWDLLRESIDLYNPQVVSLPDHLLQGGEKTFEDARDFLDEGKGRWPGVKWMYIPQSTPGDLKGWYKWLWIGLKELKRVEWVGVPRALATDIATGPNAPMERVNAVEQLTLRGYKTHALGMVNGNLHELEGLFWEGCCSVDNSSPVWRGFHGYKLDDSQMREWWDREGIPVDFDFVDEDRAKGFEHVIKHNMNLVLRILGQKEIS
jgi:hypothetical protein